MLLPTSARLKSPRRSTMDDMLMVDVGVRMRSLANPAAGSVRTRADDDDADATTLPATPVERLLEMDLMEVAAESSKSIV